MSNFKLSYFCCTPVSNFRISFCQKNFIGNIFTIQLQNFKHLKRLYNNGFICKIWVFLEIIKNLSSLGIFLYIKQVIQPFTVILFYLKRWVAGKVHAEHDQCINFNIIPFNLVCFKFLHRFISPTIESGKRVKF